MLAEYQNKIDLLPEAFEIFMNVFENMFIYLITEGVNESKHNEVFIHMMGSLIVRFNHFQNTIPKGELQ